VWSGLRHQDSSSWIQRRESSESYVRITLCITGQPEKNYDFRKDVIGGFDATDCSTACPLLGAGRTLGRNAVSDHARSNTTTVFGVVGDRREAMGAIAKREVLHATVEVSTSCKGGS